MAIVLRCQYCRKTIKAPDEAAGHRGKCPHCGKSIYIYSRVPDEDLIPLAPIDEAAERRQQAEYRRLMEDEMSLLAGEGATSGKPLVHREDLSSDDLHHYVVNYCLDMAASNLARAAENVAELRKFGATGRQAVDDFLSGRTPEAALDAVPAPLLQGFLKQLMKELR